MMDHPTVDITTLQPGELAALTRSFPILISDDDLTVLTLIKYLLERSGLTAIATLDPRDTLYICRTAPVSLVISDVMKPYLSGLDMLDRLRTDPATAALPVIFVTTCCYDDIQTPHEIDGYLRKPFTCSELLAVVQDRLLIRGRWQPPTELDPQTVADLTDTSRQFARGAWHQEVWTTRKYQPK